MKTTIVCGVDFSRHSADALRYAAALARLWGGNVRAVHAVDPLLAAAAAYSGGRAAVTKGELTRFVRRVLGPTRARRVRSFVVEGRAPDILSAQARQVRPSLIVIGTHGWRGIPRMMFGSVAEAVVRRARGPVLVIPRRSGPPA